MIEKIRLGVSEDTQFQSVTLWQLPLVVTGMLMGLLAVPLTAEALPNPSQSGQTAFRRRGLVQPATQSQQIARMEAQIFQQINQLRRSNGLSPLKFNPRLAQVARGFSQQMAHHNFYSHRGLRGDSPRQRVEAAGVQAHLVGENLMKCPCARGSQNPVTVSVQSWMSSAGHRRNILLSQMQETGVGIWQQGNTFYLTQLFIEPK